MTGNAGGRAGITADADGNNILYPKPMPAGGGVFDAALTGRPPVMFNFERGLSEFISSGGYTSEVVYK